MHFETAPAPRGASLAPARRSPVKTVRRDAATAALALVLAVFGATAPGISRAADAPAGSPRLVVDPPSHMTGEVARDAVVERTFVLSNAGTAPLKIQNIATTMNVELSSRPTEIAPGEKVSITASVDLMREKVAAILKQIEIQSNDPERPTLVLDLKILAVEYVKPKPDRARWISVQQEMDGTISSVLLSQDGKPFRILGHSTPPPGIDVVITPAPAPTDGAATEASSGPAAAAAAETGRPADPNAPSLAWKVAMTLRKNAPIGAITGSLILDVDHPLQKKVPIPLSGFMRPVIAVTPHELTLGELPAASTRVLEFFVRNFATEPIHVRKVEHALAGFGEATIEPIELGRRYKVKVPMDLSKAAPGPLRGSLRIYTDSRKVPFYSVPVDGVVTP